MTKKQKPGKVQEEASYALPHGPQLPFPPVISEDPDDFNVPGVIVEVDWETASLMGAFEETAISEAEAWEANVNTPAEHRPMSATNASDPMPAPAKPKRPRKSRGEITPHVRGLIESAAAISDARPSGEEIAFMHAVLCQIGLPRSAVQGREFKRTNGGAALLVKGGSLWNGFDLVEQPVPYGPLPRLALSYMTTYAVRHRTPEIPVGDSANNFLKLLGITKSRGSYATFRKQISALAACSLTLGFNAGGKAYTFEGKPVKQFEAWLTDDEKQRTLWPSKLILGADFYETLIANPIPHDLRALWALRGSSLAMDIYLWLAARLWRLPDHPLVLRWHQLRDQFGQEYRGKAPDKDFKREFAPALRQALSQYPEANVNIVKGGIEMRRSRPAVDPKTGYPHRHALPKTRKNDAGQA